ncbi:MAG: hypothetical protein ACRDP6_32800 [Actinoallomurus sp.]
MSGLRPGELVDVTIKGVRVDAVHPDGTPDIIADDSDGLATVWVLPPQAAIERVAPAEWPPQPGDLWRDRDGDLWFGLLDDNDEELLTVLSPGRTSKHPAFIDSGNDTIQRDHGPLALVHREEPESVFCAGSDCGHHRQLHHGGQCIGGNANEDPCRCTAFQSEADSTSPVPDSGEQTDAELIRQAARYLRAPATTIEDQAVRLERLAEAAGPLADLLDSIASDADRHVAGGWGNAEDEITGGHPTAIARALTGGRA